MFVVRTEFDKIVLLFFYFLTFKKQRAVTGQSISKTTLMCSWGKTWRKLIERKNANSKEADRVI